MHTLTFGKGGVPVSDFEAEEYSHRLKSEDLFVSTENVVLATRCGIAEGFFTPDEIQFRFKTQDRFIVIEHDDRGMLQPHPKDFCDHNLKWLTRLIR